MCTITLIERQNRTILYGKGDSETRVRVSRKGIREGDMIGEVRTVVEVEVIRANETRVTTVRKPESRSERIAQIKFQLQSGSYNVPSTLIAKKIIRTLFL